MPSSDDAKETSSSSSASSSSTSGINNPTSSSHASTTATASASANASTPTSTSTMSSDSHRRKHASTNILSYQPSADIKRVARKYRTELAAFTSSIMSTFVAFPLDFAKSRMQSYNTGFAHTVKDAYRAEGIRAFWRGVGPPLVSVTVVRTVSFSIYQRAKYAMDAGIFRVTGRSPLVMANAPGSYPSWETALCFSVAGATAGGMITLVSTPFELTKLNEQLAGKEARNSGRVVMQKAGAWATAKRLVRDRGFTGLYAGFRLHLLRDTLGTAIYFMTYESTKQLMANARGKNPASPYAVVIAGGLCGIVSWACIYPIDVAKTVYQKSLLKAGSGHAERPRIKVFEHGSYRGLGVSVMRSCLINAIFFSNFEMMKKRINALEA